MGYDDQSNIGVIAKRMAQVIVRNALPLMDEYWGTEIPLYYPTFYGGTADCVGVWREQTNRKKKSGLKITLHSWRHTAWRTMRCMVQRWKQALFLWRRVVWTYKCLRSTANG